MYALSNNELAVLELLAFKPLSFIPPTSTMIVLRLSDRGLAVFKDGHWYPTAQGLSETGRTLH